MFDFSSLPRWELLGCAYCTLLYVGLLYVWRGLPRDDVSSIKKRMGSVALACCASWIPLALVLNRLGFESDTDAPPTLAQLLGLLPSSPWIAIVLSLGLTAMLFACPIALRLQQEGSSMFAPPAVCSGAADVLAAVRACDGHMLAVALKAPFADEHLWLWRNLVVAPLCEEWVFRACMAPLLRGAGYSVLATVFATPLFFSVAHLHHLHDLVTYRGYPMSQALVSVLFQSAYTAVFGWYATWLFLRTQSLASAVLVHAFCNWMGFPSFPTMAKLWGLPMFVASLTGSIAAFAAFLGPATNPLLFK